MWREAAERRSAACFYATRCSLLRPLNRCSCSCRTSGATFKQNPMTAAAQQFTSLSFHEGDNLKIEVFPSVSYDFKIQWPRRQLQRVAFFVFLDFPSLCYNNRVYCSIEMWTKQIQIVLIVLRSKFQQKSFSSAAVVTLTMIPHSLTILWWGISLVAANIYQSSQLIYYQQLNVRRMWNPTCWAHATKWKDRCDINCNQMQRPFNECMRKSLVSASSPLFQRYFL